MLLFKHMASNSPLSFFILVTSFVAILHAKVLKNSDLLSSIVQDAEIPLNPEDLLRKWNANLNRKFTAEIHNTDEDYVDDNLKGLADELNKAKQRLEEISKTVNKPSPKPHNMAPENYELTAARDFLTPLQPQDTPNPEPVPDDNSDEAPIQPWQPVLDFDDKNQDGKQDQEMQGVLAQPMHPFQKVTIEQVPNHPGATLVQIQPGNANNQSSLDVQVGGEDLLIEPAEGPDQSPTIIIEPSPGTSNQSPSHIGVEVDGNNVAVLIPGTDDSDGIPDNNGPNISSPEVVLPASEPDEPPKPHACSLNPIPHTHESVNRNLPEPESGPITVNKEGNDVVVIEPAPGSPSGKNVVVLHPKSGCKRFSSCATVCNNDEAYSDKDTVETAPAVKLNKNADPLESLSETDGIKALLLGMLQRMASPQLTIPIAIHLNLSNLCSNSESNPDCQPQQTIPGLVPSPPVVPKRPTTTTPPLGAWAGLDTLDAPIMKKPASKFSKLYRNWHY